MATPNYNLPTISGNMTADVVRDMNALAEATDSAIKEAIDNVDLSGINTKLDTHIVDYVKHPGVGINGLDGSANKLTLTLAVASTAYKDNMGVLITPQTNTTSAATLNVNGLGDKSILKANGGAVTNLKTGVIYTLRYSSNKGAFILQGEGGSGNAQPSDVLTGKTFTNDNGEFVGTAKKSGLRIKNYQQGICVIEASNLVTPIPIAPVISGNTIVKVSYSPNSPTAISGHVMGWLVGSNAVHFGRGGSYNSSDSVIIHWEVIEFDSDVKVIQGFTTISSGSNYTVSTSTFNYQNSQLFFSYNGNSAQGLKSLIGGFRDGGGTGIHFFSRNDLTSTGNIMQIQYYVVDYT